METFITIIHITVSIFLVLVVLLQSGRSGGMGAAFGGASSQIFGGRGAGNFLAKLTTGAAVTFFLTSMTLSVMSSRQNSVVAEAKAKQAAQAAATAPSLAESGAAVDATDATDAAQPAPAPAPEPEPEPEQEQAAPEAAPSETP